MSLSTPPSKTKRLFSAYNSVGNGADTSEDTLQSFTLPANTLQNVGDTIKIYATGSFAASTDTKSARVKVGGSNLAVIQANATGQTKWIAEVTVIKTGANAQVYGTIGNVLSASANGTNSGTLALTDTNTIAILITGQDSTSGVANATTCQVCTVDFVPGP